MGSPDQVCWLPLPALDRAALGEQGTGALWGGLWWQLEQDFSASAFN